MSRLADILQQEYKSKGVFSGAASSLGKKTLEKLDIRNALFSGGGLGSVIGTKIFGKGYSATRGSGPGKTTSPNALMSDSSSLLQDINTNSKITAKNSMALPAMAKQMNIMQKNIAKLVTTFGEKPSTKADSFFSSAKFRENQYESQFSSNKKPTRVEASKEKSGGGGGILGILGSVVGGISTVISSAISGIATVITSAITTLGSTITSAVTALGTILASALLGKALKSLIPSTLPGTKPGGPGGTTPPAKKSGTPGTTQPTKKPGFSMSAEEKIAENKAKQMAAEKGAARASATKMTARSFGRAALGAVTGPIGGAFLTAMVLYDIANLLSPSELDAVETHTQTLESIQEDVDELIKNYNEGNITEDGYNRALQGLAKKAETVKQKLDALKKQILKRLQEEGQDTSSVKEAFSKSEKRIGSLEQERLQALQSAPGSGSLISPTSPSRDTRPISDEQKRLGMMHKAAKASGSAASSSTTPSRTNGQSEGLAMLNEVMDNEGITDPAIRDRIVKLAQIESSMNPNAKGPVLQSGMHKGDQARGLLQIMPKTAPEVGFSAEDIEDPTKAATAGVRYFMKNMKLFDNNMDAATIAHHAGPGGAKRYLATGSAGTVDVATGLSTNDYLNKVRASSGTASALASRPSISGETLASASQTSFEGSKNMFTPEDLASLASIMGSQTMVGGGGRLGEVSMASKATPYPKEFYNGLITANALG